MSSEAPPMVRRIQVAVLRAKERGFFIRRCNWGTYWDKQLQGWMPVEDEVDALGALIIHEQPPYFFNELGAVQHLLEVPHYWVLEFQSGFHEWLGCFLDINAPYRLGAWFAAEYTDDLLRKG